MLDDNDKIQPLKPKSEVLEPEVLDAAAQVPVFQAFDRFDAVQRPAALPATKQPGDPRVINGVEVPPGTPLAYLMDLMEREPDADYSPEQRLYHDRMRLEAAKAALPAVHARLAQVDMTARVALTHEQALDELERGPAAT